MTFFFFLPSILLSGFMFPFRGMPGWAQAIGEALPLTHFLRVVRGVLLKGNGFAEIALRAVADRAVHGSRDRQSVSRSSAARWTDPKRAAGAGNCDGAIIGHRFPSCR